jgi:hypothetical protein
MQKQWAVSYDRQDSGFSLSRTKHFGILYQEFVHPKFRPKRIHLVTLVFQLP